MILTISRDDYLQLRDHMELWEDPGRHMLEMREYENTYESPVPTRSLEIRCWDCQELLIELREETDGNNG